MSILQSPRVKDGSQNMEVSVFVVDMTRTLLIFIMMPTHSDLHDSHFFHSVIYFHIECNKKTSQIYLQISVSFSRQQMAPPRICSHPELHTRDQQTWLQQETKLRRRLPPSRRALHTDLGFRYELEKLS